jgi:hypothetical protein
MASLLNGTVVRTWEHRRGLAGRKERSAKEGQYIGLAAGSASGRRRIQKSEFRSQNAGARFARTIRIVNRFLARFVLVGS